MKGTIDLDTHYRSACARKLNRVSHTPRPRTGRRPNSTLVWNFYNHFREAQCPDSEVHRARLCDPPSSCWSHGVLVIVQYGMSKLALAPPTASPVRPRRNPVRPDPVLTTAELPFRFSPKIQLAQM